jgi:hypothetical protein
MAGFALGAGLTAFLELTSVRVRQEKDLEGVVPLKVLVGIPHLDVPGESRSRVLLRSVEFCVAVVMIILMLAGNVYAFFKS